MLTSYRKIQPCERQLNKYKGCTGYHEFSWFYFKILLLSLIFFVGLKGNSQVYLEEGFEGGAKPENWIEEYVVGTEPWRYRNGGHSPNDNNWAVPPDEVDITRNPPSAYEGTYNAIFFKQGTGNERTKLVTPELNLLGGTRIELSFYLCQIPWTFEGATGWDILRVYYKTSEAGSWNLLHEYLDPVYEWELQTLVLPNLSSTYYVAFEGHTRWGYGTCIDNVTIEEKGLQHLWIGDIDFDQPFTNYVPSGYSDLPIMRINFKVFGNTDSAFLENIYFTSLNTSDNDIASNGVKLYTTQTQTFSTDNPLGSPTNFVSGRASFTNLNYSLPHGQSYVWLSYDIKLDATHGDILDVMVAAHDILANDTLYPASNESPYGSKIIYETRYSEDFEGTYNWTLTGEFEVNSPAGLGGSPGNPDPANAYSGTKILGTDLTGLGTFLYNYEPDLSEMASNLATSPTMDLFYYKNLNLFFQRYLNIEVWDHASIQISSNGGTTWNTLWENSSYLSDFQWADQLISIPNQYARTHQFKIRYKLGPTDGTNNYSGWNVDDIYLTGEFITKDVGVSEWIYPLSGSGHSASDSVIVRVTNYGGAEITDDVPVSYSFNGGTTWTTNTLTQNIPIGGSVVFTFPTKVDLSSPGLRPSVLAKTAIPGDQFTENDQISTQVYIVPTYTPPYLEDFETNNGYWRESGTDIWEYGTPEGTVINTAASGTKSWATGLTEKYGDLIAEKNQIIFEDDFESDLGWTFSGEFERDVPSNMYQPYFAYSGLYCIGTDLTGTGAHPYNYENGIVSGTAYTATSPAIDVTHYSNIYLNFMCWTSIQAGDSLKLEVSPDNGVKWYTLWKNTEGEIMDIDYESWQMLIPDSLSYTSELKFRFSLFYSSASGPVAPGWSIDDFTLNGDLINSEPGYLTTPSFDMSGIDHPVFETKLWVETEPDIDGATLYYSLNDGDSWTPVTNTSGFDTYWNWYTGKPVDALGLNGWSGHSGKWFTARHLLPAEVIGQENVQFRFKFAADMINNDFDGIGLDRIRIMEAPQDVGVTDILDPVSACELGSAQTFTLRLKNWGIASLQAGDSIKIGYNINRSGIIQTGQESIFLTQPFAVGTTKDFIMSKKFDFSIAGEYQVNVFTIEAEPYFYYATDNDTLFRIIKVNKPYVELGDDISTVRPDTIVLSAYSGEAGNEYLWQDSSTDSVYHVASEGTYWVRVSNDLGCVASDTIDVKQLIADAGVSEWISPLSDCELGSQIPINIIIKNYGTDTMDVGDQITACYSINNEPAVEETIVLSKRINPDSTLEYVFTTLADMSDIKLYSIKAYTRLLYDFGGLNDTVFANIEAYGYTDIDLGPDTIVREFQYLLDAGPGNDTYLWQDSSTNQTFTVDTTGWYSVTVKKGLQCENTDSVHVTIVIPDISIEQTWNPVNACGYSSAERLEVYVKNTGTDTLTTSDVIPITYQVNGGSLINDNLLVSQIVLPGDSILFTSGGIIDMSDPGDYHFTVIADYDKDLVQSNDTIDQTVQVYGYPSVSLGPDMLNITVIDTTLDAGADYNSYLWQDSSANRYYTVNHLDQTPDHNYYVTITDDNGCPASDTINVTFQVMDISISEVVSPVSACVLSDQEELKIRIRNTGSIAIYNEKIEMVATIDNGVPFHGQRTLTQVLNPGAYFDFSFGSNFDFSLEGEHTVRIYTIYAKDMDTSNDTLETIINHYGNPSIDLEGGIDTVHTSLPYTLDAGADFDQYLWNGMEGGRTYIVTNFGCYIVMATDVCGCSASDTIYILPPVGINDLNGISRNLKIYPNPTDHMIYIHLNLPDFTDIRLEFYDAAGRKIFIKEYSGVNNINESLDISNLPAGMYWLKMQTEKGQVIRNIVVL
jgi:hypothetical protein